MRPRLLAPGRIDRRCAALALAAMLASPATSQDVVGAGPATLTAAAEPRRGSETNLVLPRFVTIHAREANMRRGPSTAHRIDWVFRQRGYPLEVVAEHGLWRRVRDRDAAVGWMHHSMLRNWRSAMVIEPDLALRRDPHADAPITARAEEGALGRLRACTRDWCRFVADEGAGWAPKTALWGVHAHEEFD